MTTDDYKELMLFHIMFTDIYIGGFRYAAADSDGSLWIYFDAPFIDPDKHVKGGMWEMLGLGCKKIYNLPTHKYWNETLIEI